MVELSPAFAGIELFVQTLQAAFDAAAASAPGRRVTVPDAVQRSLFDRAAALAKQAPDERLVQGAVLAVAALLSQDQDPSPLLAQLPQRVVEQHRRTHAVLRLWSALVTQRSDLVEPARAALADVMPGSGEQSLDQAKLVLLLAEGDAALDRSPRSLAVLGQVSKRLTDPNAPPGLRLQAAIDGAGALARTDGPAAGVEPLEHVLSSLDPGAGDTEQDLAFVAKAYLLVLRARGASGAERAEYAKKLAALPTVRSSDAGGGSAPASLILWRDGWVKEIDRLARVEACRGQKACVARADQATRIAPDEIDRKVGAQSGRLMRAGTLAAGSVQLQFSFASGIRVDPIVLLEPRLLAVELPQTITGTRP